MLSHFTCPCGADHCPCYQAGYRAALAATTEALYFGLAGWAESIDADYVDPTARREDPRRGAWAAWQRLTTWRRI